MQIDRELLKKLIKEVRLKDNKLKEAGAAAPAAAGTTPAAPAGTPPAATTTPAKPATPTPLDPAIQQELNALSAALKVKDPAKQAKLIAWAKTIGVTLT